MTFERGNHRDRGNRLLCEGWKCGAEFSVFHGSHRGGEAPGDLRASAARAGWTRREKTGDRCPLHPAGSLPGSRTA